MKTYEVNIPKSEDYTPAVQRMMAEGYTLADNIAKDFALALHHRVVMACNHKIELTHPSIDGIYKLVEEIAEDVDVVRDVCKTTHEAMCGLSRVYSYSEDAVGEGILDVTCELLGEYLTEKMQEKAPSKIVECYFVDKEEYIQVFIYDEEDLED